MNNQINIEAGDMGLVIAFVLLIGGVIKNFTPVNNRYIPLITWILGGLLYQWLAGGWDDPRQWMMALISVAGATGLHAATKSTFEKPDSGIADKVTGMLLVGLLSFGLMFGTPGCSTVPQTREAIVFNTFKDTWTVAHSAYQAHCENVVRGHVSREKEAQVDAAWNKFRLVFKTTFRVAHQDWKLPAPATLAAAERELLTLIRTL